MTAGAYSLPEVQRLVATLVASKPGGRVAELGTSYGDGAKAIAAALADGATFVTVELDPDRVAQAREVLAGTRAEVLQGDWRELLHARAPFDVVFADGGGSYGEVADLLAPGGILVKDDLTPGRPIAGDPTPRRCCSIHAWKRPRSASPTRWRASSPSVARPPDRLTNHVRTTFERGSRASPFEPPPLVRAFSRTNVVRTSSEPRSRVRGSPAHEPRSNLVRTWFKGLRRDSRNPFA